jgi:hypothetical protein
VGRLRPWSLAAPGATIRHRRTALEYGTFERVIGLVIPALILAIPVLGGVVLLILGFLRRRQAAELAEQALSEASFRAWQDALDRLSVPCESCGQPAHPVPASGDRYVCPACHHSFPGERHDAPLPPPET